MGYGSYSHVAHKAITKKRARLPREEVFTQRKCHALMNPHGVRFRESRDSATHPESLGIVFALDVTGSMGHIPERLARTDLPTFMKSLFAYGVTDPQVLFMAVGDATCDRAPLQVGQFESEAHLMDQWLTWSYLEGGGGGGNHESYELAMYFAARHTAMDCFEKRNKRGYLFITGDEDPYLRVSKEQVEGLIGDELDADVAIEAAVAEATRTFHPFFLIPDRARARRCERTWRDLLGDHVIVLESAEDTCRVAAGIVALKEGSVSDLDALAACLEADGLDREARGRVLRALTPFAAMLEKDGTREPALGRVHPPAVGSSGHRRVS